MLSSWMTAGMGYRGVERVGWVVGLRSGSQLGGGCVGDALRRSCLGGRGLRRGVAFAFDLLAVLEAFEDLVRAGDDQVAGVQAGLDDRVREVAGADGDGGDDGLVVDDAEDDGDGGLGRVDLGRLRAASGRESGLRPRTAWLGP